MDTTQKKKPVTKAKLREDTEAIYEKAIKVIADAVAGKNIDKFQLQAAKMVIDYLFKLGPSAGGKADDLFDELLKKAGQKPISEMSDEELLRQ